MRGQFFHQIQTFIGIGLLLLAILGFVLMILLQLPKADMVKQQANILTKVPEDLFSDSNAVNQQIRSLKVPSGVPVSPEQVNIGRSNVFESF